jgi:hypothetical protein
MNKKLVLLGILLLVGLTLSGCVTVGGYGYGGYGYGYGSGYGSGYGYSNPNNYGYGYPYGYQQPRRDWDGYRGSWGGTRHGR